MKKPFLSIHLVTLIIMSIILLVLCSCNSEEKSKSNKVSFMGKAISSPKEEFEKHLENNGFIRIDNGPTYKGDYLGKEVYVALNGEKDGHYGFVLITAWFGNPQKGMDYYNKVCKAVLKEHDGLVESDDMPEKVIGKDFYNFEGKGKISIQYAVGNLTLVLMQYYPEQINTDALSQ